MTKQSTLTKADLIEEVLRITELPRKESETIVETIFDSIIESLQKGQKIEIRGFGSFRTRERRGRIGRNPKTGAKVAVPAKISIPAMSFRGRFMVFSFFSRMPHAKKTSEADLGAHPSPDRNVWKNKDLTLRSIRRNARRSP